MPFVGEADSDRGVSSNLATIPVHVCEQEGFAEELIGPGVSDMVSDLTMSWSLVD
jgi:hypothetical protein